MQQALFSGTGGQPGRGSGSRFRLVADDRASCHPVKVWDLETGEALAAFIAETALGLMPSPESTLGE